MHSVLFLPMQSLLTNCDALSQALSNLSLAFLVDFILSDSTALIRFIAFSRYTLLFIWNERLDHSVHMSSILQVQQLYTGGTPLRYTYCQWPIIELAMNVSPKNKTAGPDSYACAFSAE